MKNKIKEHSILFNDQMVRAILEGRKTQTRRIIKGVDGKNWLKGASNHVVHAANKCPYGQPGDRLWVRETWAESGLDRIEYRAFPADGKHFRVVGQWRPSIHMPRKYSRILLEVTDVKVERIQDIKGEETYREGILPPYVDEKNPRGRFKCKPHLWHSVDEFKKLWESSYSGSWNRNDWVWVITFKQQKEKCNG